MPNFFASVILNKEWILKEAGIEETHSPSSYDSPSPLSSRSTTWWIIGGSVGGLVLVLGIVAAIIMMRK